MLLFSLMVFTLPPPPPEAVTDVTNSCFFQNVFHHQRLPFSLLLTVWRLLLLYVVIFSFFFRGFQMVVLVVADVFWLIFHFPKMFTQTQLFMFLTPKLQTQSSQGEPDSEIEHRHSPRSTFQYFCAYEKWVRSNASCFSPRCAINPWKWKMSHSSLVSHSSYVVKAKRFHSTVKINQNGPHCSNTSGRVCVRILYQKIVI